MKRKLWLETLIGNVAAAAIILKDITAAVVTGNLKGKRPDFDPIVALVCKLINSTDEKLAATVREIAKNYAKTLGDQIEGKLAPLAAIRLRCDPLENARSWYEKLQSRDFDFKTFLRRDEPLGLPDHSRFAKRFGLRRGKLCPPTSISVAKCGPGGTTWVRATMMETWRRKQMYKGLYLLLYGHWYGTSHLGDGCGPRINLYVCITMRQERE